MSDEKSQIINPYKRKLRSSGAVVHNNEKGSSSQHLPHDAKQNEGQLNEDKESDADERNDLIDEETDSSDESSDVHKDFAFRGPKQQPQESFSSEQRPRSLSLSKQKEPSSPKQQRRSSTPEQQQNPSSPKAWPTSTYVIIAAAVVVAILYLSSKGDSHSSATDTDWRSKIDPNEILSNNQRSMIRASLKPILDKSFKKDQDVGVSTLLILSSDEKSAAELARCLLGHINKKTDVNQISTEINLHSHSGGKLQLDTNLRTLLNTTGDVRAVLLRRINDIPSKDTLEQLRLLFAYCDDENPVIPHRLIIMTATSISETEDELRQLYKNKLPTEHDFIDALMSRISGHTLYVEKDQKSIC